MITLVKRLLSGLEALVLVTTSCMAVFMLSLIRRDRVESKDHLYNNVFSVGEQEASADISGCGGCGGVGGSIGGSTGGAGSSATSGGGSLGGSGSSSGGSSSCG